MNLEIFRIEIVQDKVHKMLANSTLFKLKLHIISTWKAHANVVVFAFIKIKHWNLNSSTNEKELKNLWTINQWCTT